MQKKAITLSTVQTVGSTRRMVAQGQTKTLQSATSGTRRLVSRRQSAQYPVRVPEFLPVASLQGAVRAHLTDFQSGTFSARTTEKKAHFLSLFVRFIEGSDFRECDSDAVKAFFAYLKNSHEDPKGRWGNGRASKPLRPATIETHYRVLSAFFNWLLKEEKVTDTPMRKMQKPQVPVDQIQPFSEEQMRALIQAAKKSRYPRRDSAIVLLFFDTGIRTAELCGIRLGDIDFAQKSLLILGKGNKKRIVFVVDEVMNTLRAYLEELAPLDEWSDDEHIFLSQRGVDAGQAMNRNAIYKLIRRLGKDAAIKNVRCSPHTLRHSYAITSLQEGLDVCTLQASLGHTSLKMTQRYLAISEADLKRAHESKSPVLALKRRKKNRS